MNIPARQCRESHQKFLRCVIFNSLFFFSLYTHEISIHARPHYRRTSVQNSSLTVFADVLWNLCICKCYCPRFNCAFETSDAADCQMKKRGIRENRKAIWNGKYQYPRILFFSISFSFSFFGGSLIFMHRWNVPRSETVRGCYKMH